MRVSETNSGRDRVQEVVGSSFGAASQSDVSVLLVVIDDVGVEWFDWMGVGEKYSTNFIGYAKTPFLSQCAAEGVWFDRATSEPTCGPTRASIQTGQYGNRTGFTFNMRSPEAPLGTSYLDFGFSLPDSIVFLPELLRSARPEIATGHFGKWHMCDAYPAPSQTDIDNPPLINLSDPAKYGYQTSKGNMYNVGGAYTWWKVSDGVASEYLNGGQTELTYSAGVNSTDINAWLSARTTPFFCYLAIGPPHSDYTVPPNSMVSDETRDLLTARGLTPGYEFVSDANVQTNPDFALTWKASCEAMDLVIQRAWNSIPAARRANTYLIITGDNGTVSGGIMEGFAHSKRELFWGGTRVPFIVRGPGVARPGRMAKQITHVADIYETVCDLMGVPLPMVNGGRAAAMDSVSFLPVLRDEVDREDRNALRDYVIVQTAIPPSSNPSDWIASQRRRGLFDGRWRFLVQDGVESLYDEETDPLEVTDVIEDQPEEAARMRALLASSTVTV